MKEMNVEANSKNNINKKSLPREIVEWFLCIIAAFALAIIIKYFFFTPTLVQQGSMTPTILDGERVLINRTVRTFKLPVYRGDIVTFERPDDTVNGCGVYNENKSISYFIAHNVLEIGKISYIKRVIGVAGDHVVIKDGNVYVNDMELQEVYLRDGVETYREGEYCDVVVPEGYIFVMGDNRKKGGSTDSRVFGCIPLNKLEGRVSMRLWPLNSFGKIDK